MSLREFESLEQACKEAAKIEKKAKEQEEVLSEIEEGHESQSESADTLSHDDQRSEDDNSDDFEERMFEIDEIIKQATRLWRCHRPGNSGRRGLGSRVGCGGKAGST